MKEMTPAQWEMEECIRCIQRTESLIQKEGNPNFKRALEYQLQNYKNKQEYLAQYI